MAKKSRVFSPRKMSPEGILTVVPAGRGVLVRHGTQGKLIRHETVPHKNYHLAQGFKVFSDLDSLNLALARCVGIIIEAPGKTPVGGALHVPPPDKQHLFVGPVKTHDAAIRNILMHFPQDSRIELVGGASKRNGSVPENMQNLAERLKSEGYKPIIKPENIGGENPKVVYLRKDRTGRWVFDYEHKYVLDFFDWLKMRLAVSDLTALEKQQLLEREKKYLEDMRAGKIPDIPSYI